MVKTTTRRQRDIKSKLMVAICMLLVSSIMMVSSTYAWFTLSTAPEVTGITTSVGANGNLEMALLPKEGPSATITSNVNDSTKSVEARNITWGNLVELDDTTVYGMDKIVLFPAELNVADDGKVVTSTLLKTPTYGADGRVDELVANTVTGYYNNSSTSHSFVQNDDYGVRAVGTASGMTERELDYRNAKAAANTAASQAKNSAAQSLNNNGSTLANIAIKYGTEGTAATFTQDEIAPLNNIINDLLGTADKTGSLEYIETAYLQSILAYAASAATGTEDTVWSAVSGEVEKAGATLDGVLTFLETNGSVDLPDALDTAIAEYEETLADVEEAQTLMASITGDEITWTQISPVLKLLADPDQMKVNGILASELTTGDNASILVSSLTGGNGLTVTMYTGGGVYADIADQCGDYTASVNINEVDYNGIKLNNMAARMATDSGIEPPYLTSVASAIVAAGAPARGDATDKPITDMYGYVIDLAFRTNAADSNLLLQVDPADRIYSDNTNEETMGGGSTMTFGATTTDFTNDQVKGLMDAVRIIFFNPSDGTIYARAKLATDTAVLGADGYTADITLYTAAGEKVYNYVEDTNGEYKKVTTTTYTLITEGDGYTGPKYTVDGVEDENGTHKPVINTTYEKIGTGETYTDTKYTRTETTAAGETVTDDVTLMALPQGQQTAMSVLVFLDGNYVSNGDVAATDSTSMTGTMNLQFASDANLVPMEYAQLHIPDAASTTASSEETTTASSEESSN